MILSSKGIIASNFSFVQDVEEEDIPSPDFDPPDFAPPDFAPPPLPEISFTQGDEGETDLVTRRASYSGTYILLLTNLLLKLTYHPNYV